MRWLLLVLWQNLTTSIKTDVPVATALICEVLISTKYYIKYLWMDGVYFKVTTMTLAKWICFYPFSCFSLCSCNVLLQPYLLSSSDSSLY